MNVTCIGKHTPKQSHEMNVPCIGKNTPKQSHEMNVTCIGKNTPKQSSILFESLLFFPSNFWSTPATKASKLNKITIHPNTLPTHVLTSWWFL